MEEPIFFMPMSLAGSGGDSVERQAYESEEYDLCGVHTGLSRDRRVILFI